MFPAVSSCSALGGGAWGGGGGGDKNIIHTASMHKTLAFAVFSPLCTTHCARMWNKTRCHKRPCQFRRCPNHWYLPRFCLVVRHTAQQCGAGHVVTSVHANCDDAQNTGIFHIFASLYNILRKDVEEEKLSQASMPLAAFNTKAPNSVNIEVVFLLFFWPPVLGILQKPR